MNLSAGLRAGRKAALFCVLCSHALSAQQHPPLRYAVDLTRPESQRAQITLHLPVAGRDSVDLMMAVWSPGYYVREDYAAGVERLTALSHARDTLAVTRPLPNRWRVFTRGHDDVTIEYVVRGTDRFVTRNWISQDLVVLNGAPTFITPADGVTRSAEVTFRLPTAFPLSVTALRPLAAAPPHSYAAATYDELVDSPIVIGPVALREFTAGGALHVLADAGAVPATWDAPAAVAALSRIVDATAQFWGGLPFERYVFLNIFRQGGGGLEHSASTLLTASPRASGNGGIGWLRFVAHEYFHAFNVKRLRPVELGPFDYEHPPTTSSLWISEGLTSYYANIIVTRAGVGTLGDYLAEISGAIRSLQDSPGRLRQTLEQASLGIFATGGSGIGGDRNTTVSYYVKGTVVGWLLDARIQRLTGGRQSLDDVMRLAYRRYGAQRGFTAPQFESTAAEVAGADLTPFFAHLLRSTAELDYSEALDWFGLRFAEAGESQKAWSLEVRPDATPEQRARLQQGLAARN